ncbi:hypothetical protein P691DRAFT_461424 [Macrolepiota fuliginosa MF-IS2]|uniref:Uncharacterized protein n=1 Tax=Macrolepiota fuliginosa MF-IS2 TaxID=1400762 RepID=A0A9P5XGE9_9AGAR|nr:hypothetical protein P691DRAFT_461424 [Macrolepiota fuliginosa MF-IS2]
MLVIYFPIVIIFEGVHAIGIRTWFQATEPKLSHRPRGAGSSLRVAVLQVRSLTTVTKAGYRPQILSHLTVNTIVLGARMELKPCWTQ